MRVRAYAGVGLVRRVSVVLDCHDEINFKSSYSAVVLMLVSGRWSDLEEHEIKCPQLATAR